MDTPLLNFVAAIAIGLIIGIVAGFILRGRNSNAVWLAPVLAVIGALIAAGLAYGLGDRRDYGYKEAALQVVLALAGAGLTALMGRRAPAA
jgi:uncharacterized membrane protein YeaQ/YmgE (transglycosylase-associated protein family)